MELLQASQVGAQFGFRGKGAVGILLIYEFLNHIGRGHYVAISSESQRQIGLTLEDRIIHHANQIRDGGAVSMKLQHITIALDETISSGMTFIVMDPVTSS